MKNIFLLLAFPLVMLQLAAQDTTSLYINKIKRSTCIVTPEQPTTSLILNKKLLYSIKEMSIRVQTKWNNNSIYKKRVEVESDSSIFFSETSLKPSFYNITNNKIVKKLQIGKTVNLYLILTPANPKMSIPSRRIYLGTFAVK